MKKSISIFLALIVVLSFSVSAFADGDIPNYRWIDVENNVINVFGDAGNVYPLEEVNATFWLPSEFISHDPAEEGMDETCIGLYATADAGHYIFVDYRDAEGLTLDSYFAYAFQQGFSVSRILVNDIPAIYQEDPANNTFTLMFQTRDDKLLEFFFSPLSSSLYGIVMCSIQPTDVKEEAVEEAPVEPVVPVNPVSGLISK